MKRTLVYILFFLPLIGGANLYGQRFISDFFPAVDSLPDMVYGNAVNHLGIDQQLYFDFYEPHGDTSASRPLVIYAHGGGFTEGTRKWPSIKLLCERLAKRGYAVASISYRLDPGFRIFESDTDKRAMTDAMHDMKAAIRFFKANERKFRIDTSKIFIGGESAGAVTAMMAGYIDKQNELLRYPKTVPDNVEGNSGTPGHTSGVSAVMCLCGLIDDATAIDRPDNSPLLWIHGSADPLVPISMATPIVEQAKAIGLAYQSIIFKGATHCPWYYGLPGWENYLDSLVGYSSRFMYSVISGRGIDKAKRSGGKRLKAAAILQDNMVIQQNKPMKLWGSSPPHDTIWIKTSWNSKTVQTYADSEGLWLATVDVPRAKKGDFTPVSIQITDNTESIGFSNILIGDVWMCSGQSNMEMKVDSVNVWYRGVLNYPGEIRAANYPAIRVFTEDISFQVNPQSKIKGKWEICSPETAGNFSGVAYYFGKSLFEKLNIPIGLVVTAVGGASAQAFVPKEDLMNDPVVKKVYWDAYRPGTKSQRVIDTLNFFAKVLEPSLLYNGMIHPLENLSLKGFIFYQGESNYSDRGNYALVLTRLIEGWRRKFQQGDLPFYFTQISPYTESADKCPFILGLFWEAQISVAKNLKNTGIALSMDVGETTNIHPRDKKTIGVRLGNLALHKTYGFSKIADQGPVFSKFDVDKNGLIKVRFDKSGVRSGLTTSDGQSPRFFFVAGKDSIFHEVRAQIVGKQVWLYPGEISDPIALRYGFTKNSLTNLKSKAGLPVLPFRTDRWETCPEK